MNISARCIARVFLTAAAALGAAEARGASVTCQASPGDGSTAAYWGGTLPTGSDMASSMNSPAATVTQSGESSGDSSSHGGSSTVSAGTLELLDRSTLPNGRNLTIGEGAAPSFSSPSQDAPTEANVQGVPEPCALALLAAGLVLLLGSRPFRRLQGGPRA